MGKQLQGNWAAQRVKHILKIEKIWYSVNGPGFTPVLFFGIIRHLIIAWVDHKNSPVALLDYFNRCIHSLKQYPKGPVQTVPGGLRKCPCRPQHGVDMAFLPANKFFIIPIQIDPFGQFPFFGAKTSSPLTQPILDQKNWLLFSW